mgnify:CR=1 FL=1
MPPLPRNAQPVAVLGAGAWGNALAIAASKNASTMLWARNPELVKEIEQTRLNFRYLPGIKQPEALACTSSLEQALEHVTSGTRPGLIILGVPLAGLRQICRDIAVLLKQSGRTIAGIETR